MKVKEFWSPAQAAGLAVRSPGNSVLQVLMSVCITIATHAKADLLAQEIIATGGSAHTLSFDLADRNATKRALQSEVG